MPLLVDGNNLLHRLPKTFRTRSATGVLVTHVFADSPAARDGLRRGRAGDEGDH